MMTCLKSFTCLLVILNLVFPATVFADTEHNMQSAVILPIVGNSASVEGQFAIELAQALARDLETEVNTIAPEVIAQANNGVLPAGKGYQVAARIYDQNFHQPLATINYPKSIRNVRGESWKLHHYLKERIMPYLTKPANQLWKADYDKEIVLDDRIAMRPREPIIRKPAFWAVVGGVVATGIVLGVALSAGGGSSQPGTGSVSVDFGGL